MVHLSGQSYDDFMRVAESSEFDVFGDDVDKGKHIFIGMSLPNHRYHPHHMIAENNAHPVVFGCTGSNKTTAIIIPNILWRERSFLAIDPKGEIASTVAPYLTSIGFKVVVLDPYSISGLGSSSYDPVAFLDAQDGCLADKINQIADALLEQTGVDSHWVAAARNVLVGVIAYVVESPAEVGGLLRAVEIIQGGIGAINAAAKTVIDERPFSLAYRKLARYSEWDVGNREAQSILSTLLVQLQFLDSEPIRKVLTGNDFRFEELLDSVKKVAVFVTLPPEKLASHNKYQRLMVTQAISTVSSIGGNADDPIDLYIDEAGTIGVLPILSDAVGNMRGLGLRVWTFYQTLSQVKRDFPADYENIIGNCGTLILLKVMDNTTAAYFSKKIGKPIRDSFQKGRLFDGEFGLNGLHKNFATGLNSEKKELLSPEELCQLPSEIGVVITDGPPAFFVKAPYYKVSPFCEVTRT